MILRAELLDNLPEVWGKNLLHLLQNPGRYTSIVGLGDAAGDAGQRVAVPTQGDSIADGILVRRGFEKGDYGLRHGP